MAALEHLKDPQALLNGVICTDIIILSSTHQLEVSKDQAGYEEACGARNVANLSSSAGVHQSNGGDSTEAVEGDEEEGGNPLVVLRLP